MGFTLPELPYSLDSLEPHMSKETLEYHYGKHHRTYVDKLNGLVESTDYAKMQLEDVVTQSREKNETKVFNNAAQIWNHTFFWNGLTPNSNTPSNALESTLSNTFGSLDEFKKKFSETAINTFGSGWAWLVKEGNSLKITSTQNAENPLGSSQTPLLTCDVWEHAYYIDHRNARPKYLESFWALVNWEKIEANMSQKN